MIIAEDFEEEVQEDRHENCISESEGGCILDIHHFVDGGLREESFDMRGDYTKDKEEYVESDQNPNWSPEVIPSVPA